MLAPNPQDQPLTSCCCPPPPAPYTTARHATQRAHRPTSNRPSLLSPPPPSPGPLCPSPHLSPPPRPWPTRLRTLRTHPPHRDVTFFFSTQGGASPRGGFECILSRSDAPNGTLPDWQPCTSPQPYTGRADGKYIFQVRGGGAGAGPAGLGKRRRGGGGVRLTASGRLAGAGRWPWRSMLSISH